MSNMILTDNKGLSEEEWNKFVKDAKENGYTVKMFSLKNGDSTIFDPILAGIENASKKEFTLTEKESKLRECFEILATAGGCVMAKYRLGDSSFMEKLFFLNDDIEWKERVLSILNEYALYDRGNTELR